MKVKSVVVLGAPSRIATTNGAVKKTSGRSTTTMFTCWVPLSSVASASPEPVPASPVKVVAALPPVIVTVGSETVPNAVPGAKEMSL